jgi:HK97 family phage portal protein
MGIITRLFERRSLNVPEQPLTSEALQAALLGPPASSGAVVNAATAMGVPVVFACVRLLAETIASLPLLVYRRMEGGGKDRDSDHPLYEMLHSLPNPEMTSLELRENMVGHLCLWGNAYCEIETDARGRVVALWPLRPDSVTIARQGGRRWYRVLLPDGTTAALPDERVWHVRGFGTERDTGMSVIRHARETLGLALAAQEYGARFYANDSRPGGVLRMPGKLTSDGAKRLKQSWEAAHSGLSHAHRVAVLEEGLEWQAIGLAPEDAQFLETRRFQIGEIARWFRVPPHLVGDVERSTSWGTGIEQQSIGFVVYSLRPWLVRIEQSVHRDLFRRDERATWFAEFLVDGLLRGDALSRNRALAVQRQNGIINADEWREIENRNPLPDGQGKLYLVNQAMGSPEEAASGEAPEKEEEAD